MDECKRIKEALNKVLTNLKKAPNRKYHRQSLTRKLKYAKDLYNQFLESIESVDDTLRDKLLESVRKLLAEIIDFINVRLTYKQLISFKTVALCVLTVIHLYKRNKRLTSPKPIPASRNSNNSSSSSNPNKASNMVKVDIKIGSSLISVFDGTPEHLDTFVDCAEYFVDFVANENASESEDVKAAAQKLVARFLKTRLSGIAHQVVSGLDATAQILEALKSHCRSKISSDTLLIKLKNLKELASTDDFCKEVETLCTQLKNTYIKESIPLAKANQMSVKASVDALINGVRNNETKLILKAGTFTQINEAVQKVLENAVTPVVDHSNVFYTSNNRNFQPRGFGNSSRNSRTGQQFLKRGNYSQTGYNNRVNLPFHNRSQQANRANNSRFSHAQRRPNRQFFSNNRNNIYHTVATTETELPNTADRNNGQNFLDHSRSQCLP